MIKDMEKERRKYLLSKGDKNIHSHLVIVVDRSDFIPEEITKYVERNENIKDVLFQYVCNPDYEIWNVFNYDMNLEEQINENKPYHIVAPYNKMKEAYEVAEEKHKGQTRKDGTPYINHPIKVAELVNKYFSNHPRINELVTAAYLHDTVEDTDMTIDIIKEKFGEYVAYLVAGVTKDNSLKRKVGKTVYLSNEIVNMEEDILNLKLCDRLANILDLCNAPDDFVEKYEIETIVILNYLLTNRKVTKTQMEIIKEINTQINNLRKPMILSLVNK